MKILKKIFKKFMIRFHKHEYKYTGNTRDIWVEPVDGGYYTLNEVKCKKCDRIIFI